MNIDNLNDSAVSSLLNSIFMVLNKSDPDDKRYFLEILVDELEFLDQDDRFGTEGWRHWFGIED